MKNGCCGKNVPKGPLLLKKLAVAEFLKRTRFGKKRLESKISDMLTSELSSGNIFIMPERQRVDEVLKEIGLSQSGITYGKLAESRLPTRITSLPVP
ncbi:MAG: CsgG/HfaB family protein [Fibrobacterota bacterium]